MRKFSPTSARIALEISHLIVMLSAFKRLALGVLSALYVNPISILWPHPTPIIPLICKLILLYLSCSVYFYQCNYCFWDSRIINICEEQLEKLLGNNYHFFIMNRCTPTKKQRKPRTYSNRVQSPFICIQRIQKPKRHKYP